MDAAIEGVHCRNGYCSTNWFCNSQLGGAVSLVTHCAFGWCGIPGDPVCLLLVPAAAGI